MGYTTRFTGTLKFKNELTIQQLIKLKEYFDTDSRKHPEWGPQAFNYIDLELAKDASGLQWDGSEKTYGMVEAVNFIITEMQKEFPDFSLTGSMLAQGEEIGDIWRLIINENGIAEEVRVEI